MSSIIHKIDQALHPEQREYAAGQPAGTGNVPRGAATTTGMGANHRGAYTDPAYAGTNNYTTGGGLHNSGNQADAYGRHLPGPAPNTAGPHRSDILNKLDPRVDSDMSNPQTRAAHAAAMRQATGPAPNTAGPHRSDLLNKLDPTVDSDLSTGKGAGTGGLRTGGMRAGAYEAPAGAGMAGSGHRVANAPEGTGYNQHGYMSGGTGAPGNVAEGTYGPHKSRLANALDPRVDSDADSRRYAGAPGAHGQHAHGQHAHGQHAYGATQPAMQPMNNTTATTNLGPHKSSLLNKLDPKVDSQTGRIKPPRHI